MTTSPAKGASSPSEKSDKTEPVHPAANFPNWPPYALILRGHVGDLNVYVCMSSYTLAMNVIGMYERAAQSRKESAALDLYDTHGVWLESEWTLLKHSEISKRMK